VPSAVVVHRRFADTARMASQRDIVDFSRHQKAKIRPLAMQCTRRAGVCRRAIGSVLTRAYGRTRVARRYEKRSAKWWTGPTQRPRGLRRPRSGA
jgi:hypothetical protein